MPPKRTLLDFVKAIDDEKPIDRINIYNTVQDLKASNMVDDANVTFRELRDKARDDKYAFFKTEFFRDKLKQEEDAAKDPLDSIPDGPYTCAKCSSKKILVTQEQLRSGDEGATTMYECKSCGKIWR
jgi:DNA-directed RNA polymerase subunit M/transcription elongation factor TFIIS